jgi:hypothetical protein
VCELDCSHLPKHLLSALLETELDIPTLSWSLTAYPSPCYVEVSRGLTPSEIDLIQTKANRLVVEGRKVHIEVEELDRASDVATRVLESGRSVGKGLPEDYTGGVKRTVIIDGVDRNPYVYFPIFNPQAHSHCLDVAGHIYQALTISNYFCFLIRKHFHALRPPQPVFISFLALV